MRAFQYQIASSLDQAKAGLGQSFDEAVVKGGGVDLADLLKERLIRPARLVAIGGVPGLAAVTEEPGKLVIGAAATLAALAAHPVVAREFPAVARAAAEAATPQLRAQATAAGNLCQRPRCWYFRSADHPCLKKGDGQTCPALEGENALSAVFGNQTCAAVHPSNLAPALVAHQASLVIASPGNARTVPVEQFFVTPEQNRLRENVLTPDGILVEIHLPRVAGGASAYREVRHRASFDWPLAACAVAGKREKNRLREARVALGAVAPVPLRLPAVETLVEGQPMDRELAARAGALATEGARPLANNAYKLALIKAVVADALLAAAGA